MEYLKSPLQILSCFYSKISFEEISLNTLYIYVFFVLLQKARLCLPVISRPLSGASTTPVPAAAAPATTGPPPPTSTPSTTTPAMPGTSTVSTTGPCTTTTITIWPPNMAGCYFRDPGYTWDRMRPVKRWIGNIRL
jgi:hypothetical protein